MEWESVNRGGLDAFFHKDEQRLQRWKDGQTGVPLVDACMRSLCHTGYLNFRMRAMLVSYATHVLRLPWKSVSAHLAQQFLDFEPGIHYPQLQMQAGVTGINTVRIYNPVKQALEHDPQGNFVAHWVPELAHIPMPMRHSPWNATALEAEVLDLGSYPSPMVDLEQAMRDARKALYQAKRSPEARKEAERILAMHVQGR
jgi:deoxyribodipyrimidine photo-lyase